MALRQEKCGRERSRSHPETSGRPGQALAWRRHLPAPIWRAARQGMLRRHSWTGGGSVIAAFCTGQSGVGGPPLAFEGSTLPSERFLLLPFNAIETRDGWCLEQKMTGLPPFCLGWVVGSRATALAASIRKYLPACLPGPGPGTWAGQVRPSRVGVLWCNQATKQPPEMIQNSDGPTASA